MYPSDENSKLWTAGVFDGDGCVSANPRGGGVSVMFDQAVGRDKRCLPVWNLLHTDPHDHHVFRNKDGDGLSVSDLQET